MHYDAIDVIVRQKVIWKCVERLKCEISETPHIIVLNFLHKEVSFLMFSNKMFRVWRSCTQTKEPHFCFMILRKNESMFFSKKKLYKQIRDKC